MLWVTVLVYQLIVYEFVFRSVRGSWRAKRSSNLVCPRGCTACSRVNGCITCEGRLFMFLSRQNMRETGICLHSCPAGYYGVRHAYYSKCYRCHIQNCQVCFDRTFCSLCQEPYVASEGQCLAHCPEGLYYANYTRECQDRVDCLLGAWSPWSECMRNGQTCGYRSGFQTRTRQILQEASPNGTPCSQVTDTLRCRIQRRHCDGKCGRRKKKRRKNKKSSSQGHYQKKLLCKHGGHGKGWNRKENRWKKGQGQSHHRRKEHFRRACLRHRCQRRKKHCHPGHVREL